MPQLAFFPWIELGDDLDVGSYSLKRFKPGSLPSVDDGLRATLDSVLAPYRDTSGRPVGSSVILTAGRGLTDALSAEDREDLFCFAELFSFAALATREFFTQDHYFNRDYLRLVIQGFADPKGDVVVVTRRKDGGEKLIIPRTCYRVQAPDHVAQPGRRIKPDRALLHALLASREHKAWSRLYQGIVLFNQANTDAPDTSPDTELVLTYAAMEQILGISSRPDRRQFHAKFAEAWYPTREVPRGEWRAPPTGRTWTKNSLRACWASDLKQCRGNLAHGNGEGSRPSPWTVRQHLLLTSFAVPRLVKQVLSGLGFYEPTASDTRDLDVFESLLNLPDVLGRASSTNDVAGSSEGFEWQRLLPSSRSLEYVFEQLRPA